MAEERSGGIRVIRCIRSPSSVEPALSGTRGTHRIRQCAEERDDVSLLVTREVERVARQCLLRRRDAPTSTTAAIVEVEHLLQRSEHAVVHVRGGKRNVAQRRRLEREAMKPDAIHGKPTDVGIDPRAIARSGTPGWCADHFRLGLCIGRRGRTVEERSRVGNGLVPSNGEDLTRINHDHDDAADLFR